MTRIAVELVASGQAAQEARGLIRNRLGEVIPATTLWDLLTVVSELVTNAVRHGESETVRVRLGIDFDGNVAGEVENDGRGRVEPRPIDVASTSGMGLHIVAALAERWWVYVNGSTLVAFELSRP
jgi:anti-sigma regulatory factor (Ser/Thr protein kinase)